MRLKWRNVFLVARSELIRWICNPRIILMFVLLLPIREMLILPMAKAAQEMEQPLNFLESGIAAVNSGLVLLLLPLVYLTLISSFPTVDGNMLPYIMRMGRKNWILGEMLFQILSVFIYCATIFIMTVIQTADISFLANGWSIPVTDYDRMIGNDFSGFRMGNVVHPNIHCQMPPYKALYLSYGLLALFLLSCSMTFLLGSLYGKKLLTFFLVAVQVALGCGISQTRNGCMWLFPFSHSVLAFHYQRYFRAYVFSPWMSIAFFAMILAVLAFESYRKAKKADLDRIGEGIL